jgi:hypothetical protein
MKVLLRETTPFESSLFSSGDLVSLVGESNYQPAITTTSFGCSACTA